MIRTPIAGLRRRVRTWRAAATTAHRYRHHARPRPVSRDCDVYRAKALEIAEAELRAAAARDIGDWFRFEIGPMQAGPVTAARPFGCRSSHTASTSISLARTSSRPARPTTCHRWHGLLFPMSISRYAHVAQREPHEA